MKKMKLSLLGAFILVAGLTSCDKKTSDTTVPAITKTDSIRVTTNSRSGNYSLYSFAQGKEVPTSDSASTKWDFGIRFATIIVNSMASGPGNVGVITQSGQFDTFKTAPATGYVYDSTVSKKAIDSDLNTGWYDYNSATHAFSPKAGKFFVFKTTDNKYVKMEILSARYEAFTGPMPLYVWYKFRYSYQADGTRDF